MYDQRAPCGLEDFGPSRCVGRRSGNFLRCLDRRSFERHQPVEEDIGNRGLIEEKRGDCQQKMRRSARQVDFGNSDQRTGVECLNDVGFLQGVPFVRNLLRRQRLPFDIAPRSCCGWRILARDVSVGRAGELGAEDGMGRTHQLPCGTQGPGVRTFAEAD